VLDSRERDNFPGECQGNWAAPGTLSLMSSSTVTYPQRKILWKVMACRRMYGGATVIQNKPAAPRYRSLAYFCIERSVDTVRVAGGPEVQGAGFEPTGCLDRPALAATHAAQRFVNCAWEEGTKTGNNDEGQGLRLTIFLDSDDGKG
jgi:hypothetical protein